MGRAQYTYSIACLSIPFCDCLFVPTTLVVRVMRSGAAVCVSVCSNEMTTDLDIRHGSSCPNLNQFRRSRLQIKVQGDRRKILLWSVRHRVGAFLVVYCDEITLIPRLHDTTGCQCGLTTRFDNRLNKQWLFVQHGWQTGCTTGLTTGLTTGCIV